MGFGSFKVTEMTPIDTSYPTYYCSVAVTLALSCTTFELFDTELYCHPEI